MENPNDFFGYFKEATRGFSEQPRLRVKEISKIGRISNGREADAALSNFAMEIAAQNTSLSHSAFGFNGEHVWGMIFFTKLDLKLRRRFLEILR